MEADAQPRNDPTSAPEPRLPFSADGALKALVFAANGTAAAAALEVLGFGLLPLSVVASPLVVAAGPILAAGGMAWLGYCLGKTRRPAG